VPTGATATTRRNETRVREILQAAAQILVERGYGDTRIVDVAKQANVSTALLFYYFGTREQLLLEALKFSEAAFYREATANLRLAGSLRERLDVLINMTCVADDDSRIQWGLWFELWGQAQRHADVAEARAVHDEMWRELIAHVAREGQLNGEVDENVDVRRFAISMAAFLDGLTVQVALNDSAVTQEVARDLAMNFAAAQLGLRGVGVT